MSAPGLPARAAAQKVLSEVLRRRCPLDAALAKSAALEVRDAGFARAIAGETLRRLGQLEALIRTYVPKPPARNRAGSTPEILLAASCELLFLGVAAHAAVDAANRLAQADEKAVHFKPLINAVLRRVAREGKNLVAAQDAARLNTPDWLWQRWFETYGEKTTRAIASAHLGTPPLDIVTKGEPPGVPEASPLFGRVWRLDDPARVDVLPGYADGGWWVQDAAATLSASLLGDVRGKAVIDLCAAPGGKTAQLAAAGAQVTAVERDATRMERLRANLRRLRLDAELVVEDARDFHPKNSAPLVLLDAPCSATGTIRRHPELPWIKNAGDVTLCAQAAGELLDAAADLTAEGGLLVFAVCSLEREEGHEQVESFLRRRPEFSRVAVVPHEVFGLAELIDADGDLRTLPCHLAERGGMDGFYAARLRRRS
ncbi:MAG: RsmB/NOP family class I SAM-dependent RNA methyltransferase [Alphaproteobacteria bacterium]|nr:RsmB/NOP family class I SAM-dependent RNA methyltransferase [Alphaproteobacteria bacterium]MDE2630545.1 RsmB/NOP family class I SAM-dependent RNA methyltransferase [Alphaproteobacteria bacterium]